MQRSISPLAVAWRWLLVSCALAGWIGLLVYKLYFLGHGGHQVDDSYMFYRYALHLREGLGMSWNPSGVHTYGMTTVLWTWLIVPFSMLPFSSAVCLTLASWCATGLAIVLCSMAVWSNAESAWLRDKPLVLGLVCLSLLSVAMFDYASASGMETMLGFALLSALTGMVLLQAKRSVRPEWIGVVAFLLYLTRPESLLPAVLMILLAGFLLRGVRPVQDGSRPVQDGLRPVQVMRALLVLGVLVGLALLVSKLYFGSAFPLPFYIKSRHDYVGYQTRWYPFTNALMALRMCTLFTLCIALLADRRSRRMLWITLVPLAAVTAYLCTVTQIMGFHERYYVPYLALLVIPAFLVLDRRLVAGGKQSGSRILQPGSRVVQSGSRVVPPGSRVDGGVHPGAGGLTWKNAIATALVVLFAVGAFPYRLVTLIERHTEPDVIAFRDVVYGPGTHPAPPANYFASIRAFSRGVASYLPAGTTVASSEVGELGVVAPQINIIDTAGLNDNAIAMHGFDAAALLARRPDVIWLPHTDYTWERGELMTDPAFLKNYDLYAGAFNYGLAVRKDSPAAPIVRARLAAVWPLLYPGTTPESALVQSVQWPAGTTVPPVTPPGYANRASL